MMYWIMGWNVLVQNILTNIIKLNVLKILWKLMKWQEILLQNTVKDYKKWDWKCI